ncbi:MAG: hypothetical protein FT714_08500 [Pantoea sp. Pent]|nr:hypothetical protein [Pantoea sp. Pent]
MKMYKLLICSHIHLLLIIKWDNIRSFGDYRGPSKSCRNMLILNKKPRRRSVAIASQQNRLAVKLLVRTEGRIKTVPFNIQTKLVFDGKGLPGKACFIRLSRHQQVSWPMKTDRRQKGRRSGARAFRGKSADGEDEA